MNRVKYIDIAKAFAILFVIMGHVVDTKTMTKTWIYAFHMPLFFILSGMTLKMDGIQTVSALGNWLKKRALSLLFPYAVWGFITSKFSINAIKHIAYGSRQALKSAKALTSLWFLPVMFLALILAEAEITLCRRLLKEHSMIAIAAFSVINFAIGTLAPFDAKRGDLWGGFIAFTAAGFLLLGVCLRGLCSKVEQRNVVWIPVVTAMAALGLFILLIGRNHPSEGYVLMATGANGNVVWFVLTALFGSLVIIFISMALQNVRYAEIPLTFIGTKTMGIFLVHKPMVTELKNLCKLRGLDYNHFALMLAITLSVLLVSLVFVNCILHFFPPLIGEQKKNG